MSARLSLATTIALLAAGCALPDEVTGEARSPDGALVARAWCLDGCDIFQKRTITISPSSSAAGEHMPATDDAARVYIAEQDGARLALRWTAARVLRIEGDCLSDDRNRPHSAQRFGEVRLEFVRSTTRFRCPAPIG